MVAHLMALASWSSAGNCELVYQLLVSMYQNTQYVLEYTDIFLQFHILKVKKLLILKCKRMIT